MKKFILIKLMLILGFSATAQDSLDCTVNASFTYTIEGGVIYFTNTSTDEPDEPFYNWWIGDLTSTEENPSFPTGDFDESEFVCFSVHNETWECEDSLCTTIYFEVEDSVVVDDSTECMVSASFTYSIDGDFIYFTNTSTDEPAVPFYNWWVGDLTSTEENPSFPIGDFDESELVCFSVHDETWECEDSVCTTIYFEVEDSVIVDDSTECMVSASFTYSIDGDFIYFTNTSTDEPAVPFYNWWVGDLTSTEENPSFPIGEFDESEFVCFSVHDESWECEDSICTTIYFDEGDTTITDSTVSIIQLEKEEVSIYPNPTTTQLNVRITNSNSSHDLLIYNALGELVRTEQMGLGETQISINLTSLPNGFYIINVIDSADHSISLQQKFVKN